jgi:hypothetical protein
MHAMHKLKGTLRGHIEEIHHGCAGDAARGRRPFVEETYAIKIEEDEMTQETLDSLDRLVQFLVRKGVA